MAFARLSRGVPAALAAFLACVPAMAQSEPDFYAGKNLQVVIGVSAGGGYDTWGRIVARHIVRKLPGNPTAVPQNMPGAGSITAGNHIFNAAARDGTVIGILNRDAPLAPLTGSAAARFDATRFSWIGTPTVETNVCFVSSKASVRSIEDISKREVILGAVGPGSGSYNYPKALAGLLDLKIKLISGFPGSTDVLLAMERGEVDGMCESLDSVESRKPGAIKAKQLHVLFQGGMEPSPELPGVPFIRDFARTEEERQAIKLLYAGQGLGRPFIAPPGIPAERLAILRKAFVATLEDAEFRADAAKRNMEIQIVTGEEIAAVVARAYASTPDIVARVRRMGEAR